MDRLAVFLKIIVVSALVCTPNLATESIAEGLMRCVSPKEYQKSTELQRRLQDIIDSSENISTLNSRLKMEGELGSILVDYGAYFQKYSSDRKPVKLSGKGREKVLNFHIVNMFALGGNNNLSSDFISSHKQFLSVNSKYCVFNHDGFVVNLVGSLFNTNLEYFLLQKERQKKFRALVKNYRYLSKYKILGDKDVDQDVYLKTYIKIMGTTSDDIIQEEIDFWNDTFGYKIFDTTSEVSSMRYELNVHKNKFISAREKNEYWEKFNKYSLFGQTFGRLTKKYVFNTLEHKISSIQTESKINLAKVLLCQIYLVHNQELLQFYVCEK